MCPNLVAFLSQNVVDRTRAAVKSILNMRELDQNSKYLGNLLFPGRKPSSNFDGIVKRVKERLTSLKAKLLSQARKATLVKHVISSIPIYVMATNKILRKMCIEVEKKV